MVTERKMEHSTAETRMKGNNPHRLGLLISSRPMPHLPLTVGKASREILVIFFVPGQVYAARKVIALS